MIENTQEGTPKTLGENRQTDKRASQERRAALKRLGRFVAVTAPTVTLFLAAGTRPARAPCLSCTSSRQFKTTGTALDTGAILADVSGIAVNRWRDQRAAEHFGPHAKDFQSTFGIGDGVTINTIDAIGVCLAAIKGLSTKVDRLEANLSLRAGP